MQCQFLFLNSTISSKNQLRVVFKVRPFISLDKLQVLHIIFDIIMMFILWLTAVKVMELNKRQI